MDKGGAFMESNNQTQTKEKTSNAGFYRLCASLFILGMALILRTFFPDQTREFLHRNVAGGMDYTALLGDVGDSLRTFVLGVPHPGERDLAEAAAEDADLPEGETFDPENEPSPGDADADPTDTGIGGFEAPILWADARYFISDYDHEDDTLPLPFGFSKPERVDYTVYDMPFEPVRPAAGSMTSSFGYRIHPIYGDWRFHYGIDFAGAAGTPIYAFAGGTVLATGRDSGYGNYLFIEHDGGFVTLYAHCQRIHVRSGQTVKAGQEVASIGSTGLSTGPHLHFELRRGGVFLDPSKYLEG
jgi:murein DD-endopeptidase MepM/ murein hydrolase activator NlpD